MTHPERTLVDARELRRRLEAMAEEFARFNKIDQYIFPDDDDVALLSSAAAALERVEARNPHARALRQAVDDIELCIDALEGRDGAGVLTVLAGAIGQLDRARAEIAVAIDPHTGEYATPAPADTPGGEDGD